jgi:hypothetical protein
VRQALLEQRDARLAREGARRGDDQLHGLSRHAAKPMPQPVPAGVRYSGS